MKNEIHHRDFGLLLSDAIFFEKLARNESNEQIRKRYARSSIIFSSLILECAANCCLSCFEINTQLKNDLDKLPFLTKLDLFALHGFKKQIDYGRHEVQKVNEIKSIRDSIVHPKVIKTIVGNPVEGERHFASFPYNLTFSIKPKPATGMIGNSSLWTHRDCFTAIQTVIEFFNYFFQELLEMEKGLVFGLLNDAYIEEGNAISSIYVPTLFDEIAYLKEKGVSIKFMVTEP